MTGLLDLALGALPNVLPYLAAVLGGAVLFLTGRSSGAARVRRKQAEATVRGVQEGANGAAKAEADLRAGKTPQQIKEENDHAWR